MSVSSPIGKIELQAENGVLKSAMFVENSTLDSDDSFLLEVKEILENYFESGILETSITLEPEGTDFQRLVWKELQNIPNGETISYLDLALKCGGKTYTRAVANANSKNPISIFVPCHRVIGSDGSLTGYAGGMDRKKYLLKLESKNPQLELF